ncbi:hypothetical protein EPUS_05068 [Endocarpon pusillum Z07020]|uniref:Transcriptional regulator n=1 Tax=Endocarpon pusillum (strain Z07020 / HMAS-L-300199) TaxID=1263415 RepID=U1G6I6_ENDPU|nr:uncharacterized protein EPUS_05068 [Endocarpon pusillum Z07020]ERF72987.1 hypothetical protein EPUS_05068 [Endocarpon pusillum Z07020]
MSDSDLSDAPRSASIPSYSELEQALRTQVRDALKAGRGDDASITVSSMRKAAEEALGLDAGFYKSDEKWKGESKRIVLEAFDEYGADQGSPVKSKSPKAKPSKTSKPPPSKKRASPEVDNDAPKKRKKTQAGLSSKEALSTPPSEVSKEEKPKSNPKSKTKKPTQKSIQPAKATKPEKKPEPVQDHTESEVSDAPDAPATVNDVEASDSELSVLIDEDPPPKKKRKGSSAAAEKRGRKPSAPKAKATDADINDPDQAEIKRLQGWLVKCGIRKLWGKELKSYESSKAKIKHLKEMLADAGMTGRYSIEKASQIKEARELKADIEAVKEGAERWGKEKDAKGADVDSDGRKKPKGRLVRGSQVLDFLSSDGEETD